MSKKTILIVDDTFENLYLLRVILEEVGYHVIEANDGSEGLKKLHENKNVNLIISDILMPIMDGFMFCQACKKDKLFEHIPFVFYTSTYTEKLDEDFALKLGAAHFLRKPIDHDEVIRTVETIFGGVHKPSKIVKKPTLKNEDVFKLYNERLINKLEHKSLDLEKEIVIRKNAETLLIQKNEILDVIAHNTPLNKVFDHILLSYESNHPSYYASISLLDDDGVHLDLISAPSMPASYNLALKRFKIGKNVGSCGTAAFTKKPVIVSDISTDKLWEDYKDIALKHHLKSCWSIPILTKSNDVVGTFAIYSKSINSPSKEEVTQLNNSVSLAYIAIEKAKIKAEVKKRDESYKSLVDQASDAIVTYSLEGDIFDFNKAAYTNLGYNIKEFKALKLQDLLVGGIIEDYAIYNKMLKGKATIFNRKLICKDESLIDVEISAKLQKDGKVLAIVRDITDRKKAEVKLQESEKALVVAQKIAKIGSYNYDFHTQIVHASSTFYNILGVDLDTEITLDVWRTISHPDDTQNNEKVLDRCIKTGEIFDLEYRILTKNKKELKWIHGRGEIIYYNGKASNFVGTIQDITERKQTENKIAKTNEQLTIANKELNQLRNQLEQENVYLRNELDLVFNYEEMVYGSAEFSDVLTELEKVAPTTATVLLLGESGTGKELLARAVHNTSLRNNKPLIKVNCSAIPRELIESELFGHKKGSFTGAFSDKIGKFELADGGTLFLDEIGELPLDMQPKILRFLQEGEIEVVGGTGLKKLDVRVIAATNRNLKEEIENKRFREDLYFRLNVFPIVVPPLRNRKDDIPLLVEHFVDKFNKAYGKSIKYITDDAMSKLKAYEWPGNIRELENLIERASILSTSDTLVIPGFESSTQKTKAIKNKDLSLNATQRKHILQVLEQCNWKISGPNGAAILLDLKPSTLRDKMTKLGIVKPLKK